MESCDTPLKKLVDEILPLSLRVGLALKSLHTLHCDKNFTINEMRDHSLYNLTGQVVRHTYLMDRKIDKSKRLDSHRLYRSSTQFDYFSLDSVNGIKSFNVGPFTRSKYMKLVVDRISCFELIFGIAALRWALFLLNRRYSFSH